MSAIVDRLLQEALALPAEERARLIAELMSSVDEGPDATDSAWVGEMVARADRAIAGETPGIPLSDVRARAAKVLKKR